MRRTMVDEMTSTPEGMKLFQQERMILEVTEMIWEIMEKGAITKSELAHRLEKSKAYVTQLLNGMTNMTLRTVSDVLFALGKSGHLAYGDLSRVSKPWGVESPLQWSSSFEWPPKARTRVQFQFAEAKADEVNASAAA